MEPAVLGQAEGQVPVRAQVAAVDDRALGAVHRLEAVFLALDVEPEHALCVQVPVAGLLPELPVDELRSADLLVAAPPLELAHRPLEDPPDALTLGVPEGRARADIVEAEEIELDAQPAMVALLRLGPAPEVAVELVLGGPDRAVDALEHRALLVAPPVGAGDREQLERADPAGARHVGTLAQVDERAVLVDRDRRHRPVLGLRRGGEVVDDLDLERLPMGGEEGASLLGRELAPDERVVGRDAQAHPLLDRFEVLGGERARQLEVVVEAVADRRPDPELRAREEVENRLGHDVGGRVAHRVELAVGTGVEKLVDRPALGDLEQLVGLVPGRALSACLADRRIRRLSFVHRAIASRESETSRPSTGREVVPPAVPPAFATVPAGPGRSRSRAALTGGPGPVHRPLTGGTSSLALPRLPAGTSRPRLSGARR